MIKSTAPLWRVRELHTATDRHTTVLDEWSEMYKLDAVKRFVQMRSAAPDYYTGQISLHLVDPAGADHTADALTILRAAQMHYAGECVESCPECSSGAWVPPLASAGVGPHTPWLGRDGE